MEPENILRANRAKFTSHPPNIAWPIWPLKSPVEETNCLQSLRKQQSIDYHRYNYQEWHLKTIYVFFSPDLGVPNFFKSHPLPLPPSNWRVARSGTRPAPCCPRDLIYSMYDDNDDEWPVKVWCIPPFWVRFGQRKICFMSGCSWIRNYLDDLGKTFDELVLFVQRLILRCFFGSWTSCIGCRCQLCN